jgi:UPF0176 protein
MASLGTAAACEPFVAGVLGRLKLPEQVGDPPGFWQTARPMQSPVINIAAYQFAQLSELKVLRANLLAQCKAWQLRGTILLSPEGVNLFVAGAADAVESLLSELRTLPGLAGLAAKYSETAQQPFTRMLVRIKKEIIAFGVPGIEPARYTSPRIAPKELKQWLDEGRPFTLVDTRNDYEVKLGTFHNAIAVGVDTFREFPQAVARLPAELKNQPIVTFCTGGIRCEKAAPFMESQGFREVYQLDGGILKYFEECGSAHYAGDCFVFDQRVGLDPTLHETPAAQCYKCLSPLSEAEQQDTRYVAGKSCPYCFKSAGDLMAISIAARHAAMSLAMTPLPGSVPRDNLRPINVSQRCDGATLVDALCHAVKHLSADHWSAQCRAGMIVDDAHQAVAADRIVRAGERYLHRSPQEVEPDVSVAVQILYEDEAIVVLNKPAPLPMHPAGRFSRNTLQFMLEEVYRPQKPRPAHRLDANTTGVLVVARTRHFAGRLQPQFATGQIEKRYLVRVHGHPAEDAFECHAPIASESSEMGTRVVDYAGLPSSTRFTVRARCADGSSILEAQPLSGRTNQIRIHCAHLGFPVCGDQAYRGDGASVLAQTAALRDASLCLHAWKLKFQHPASGQVVEFEAPPPNWSITPRG